MSPKEKNFKQGFTKSLKSFVNILPMMFAVIGLVGLFQSTITPEMLHTVFNGSILHDTIAGTFLGGISVGQPVFSYIIGGELLNEGISIYGVTAFIVAWVSLGVIQLPLEWSIFGGRFTVTRNLLSLCFALLIAFITGATMGLLS